MSAKVILSSKGQLVIPKELRTKLRLHFGSELLLELTENNSLEIFPVTQNISKFFGMGKNKDCSPMTIDDIDEAIAITVRENDRY